MGTLRTGIDVSPSAITAAQIRIDRGRWRLLAGAQMARRSESAALDAEEAQALESLLFRRGFAPAACVLSAPAEALSRITMELPPATSKAPVEQLARAEFARRTRLEPGAFELGYWDLPAAGRSRQVFAVGCAVAPTDQAIESLEAAGLRVAGVDDPACALARLVAGLPGGSAAVRVGARLEPWGCSIVVLHHATLLYARSPAGLALEPDPAEHPRIGSRLAQEIEACVGFARHRCRSHAPATVTLLGAGAACEPIARALDGRFGQGVIAPVDPAGQPLDARLAPAVGLALLEDLA